MSDIRLDGKVAVITGATGGWGSGAAVALADRGAKVVLNARTQSKLDVLAERLTARGADAVGMAEDVKDLAGSTRLVARTVERYGRLDILVNSAGMRSSDGPPVEEGKTLGLYGGDLLDIDEDVWNTTIVSELTMIYACTKAAVEQMVRQGDGGSVITVIGTILGQGGQSAHAGGEERGAQLRVELERRTAPARHHRQRRARLRAVAAHRPQLRHRDLRLRRAAWPGDAAHRAGRRGRDRRVARVGRRAVRSRARTSDSTVRV